jgi:hypothetical protein
MEFGSISASRHTIEPIGYNELRKTTRIGTNVRSATEQYEIHCIAQEFQSDILRIPTPYRLESHRSYVMEHVQDCTKLPSSSLSKLHELDLELLRFKQWCIDRYLFPMFFSILRSPSHYILVDFSRFGVMDRGLIHVPGFAFKFTLSFIGLFYDVKYRNRRKTELLDALS